MNGDQILLAFVEIQTGFSRLGHVAPPIQPAVRKVADYAGLCVSWSQSVPRYVLDFAGRAPLVSAKIEAATTGMHNLLEAQHLGLLANETLVWLVADNIEAGFDLLKRLPGTPVTPYPIPDKPKR